MVEHDNLHLPNESISINADYAKEKIGGSVLTLRQKIYLPFKRLFDILLSSIALVFVSPLLIVVCIAIRIEDKGPAFYSHTRVGKNGKEFTMYKLRSMCRNAEELKEDLEELNEMDGPVFKIADDPRVTKIGKFIRKFSIDELPQLLNVIKGDMSIVGPRPPLPQEVAQYTPYQMQRLNIKSGLTCYWQISGRSNTNFERWVNLDLFYIKKIGLLTDLSIICKTFPVVFKGTGAY